jgi:hypothetical protein
MMDDDDGTPSLELEVKHHTPLHDFGNFFQPSFSGEFRKLRVAHFSRVTPLFFSTHGTEF